MQIGISTASFFNKYALEDIPQIIAGMGASCCEVFLNTFSEYQSEYVLYLKQCLQEAKLDVYSVHPLGSQFESQLFSLHPRQRADAFKMFELVVKAGKELGASCYVIHGPASQNGVVKNMELKRIGPLTQELCEIAKEYGLTLAWENVSWCLFNKPEFGLRLLEATKADDLRFTLDIKQAARSGYPPLEYLRSVGDHLVNLHICDYTYLASGQTIPLLPGEGECDLLALKQALHQVGYAGPAFVEVYSDMFDSNEQLQQSFEYVRRCIG
ncbi:sugar phosphate isomerase/epimerase [Eubacteriales bacterium OttesenSCG-928-K08]|nr:sugar phosphate isomerase/epimerase [Eubacteriales bacterium OttesenSCG-928-K08]